MEKVNTTVKAYAQILTFLVLWIALVVYAAGPETSVTLRFALARLPQAVTAYVAVGLLFTKLLWRSSLIQGWLIKVPDLQGTWRGELISDYVDPATGTTVPPIPVVLVIRQTFSSIRSTMMTSESTSYSTTAAIDRAPGTDELYLTYCYTNRSRETIRERSPIHDGAAVLKIIREPGRSLEGGYWTSRKTKGDMVLRFESKKLAEKFTE